jgi:para-nitrobenzyl esterase
MQHVAAISGGKSPDERSRRCAPRRSGRIDPDESPAELHQVHLVSSWMWAAAVAVALTLGMRAAADADEVRVNTQAGIVEGVADVGIVSFKGIPYAAPPVGERRWKAPQAPAPWDGTHKAVAYGNACIQPPGLSAKAGGDPGPLSEDCLYLNVWTPRADPAARLPVVVWIHGGAYVFGAGGLPGYDGTPLARKGAVAVNLNYRLGALGFFAHPALERETPGGPANFGLLDQIAALEWVQRNITAFGGDPGNVTIIGQSAGAKSVLALFSSPRARGLFHRGIAMSSYALPDATRAKAMEVGANVATAVGLRGAAATAAELRGVPAEMFGELRGRTLSNSPVPIVGDEVLPRSIVDTFAAGKEAPLPLILGNTSDDASVETAFGIDPAKLIQDLHGAGVFVKLLYPGVTDDSSLGRLLSRDAFFTMPVRRNADWHSALAPTWRYYFSYTAVRARATSPYGVTHGADIVYALDTGDISLATREIFTDPDRDYARTVSDYFFAFASTGRPSAPHGPAWPNHDARQDRTMNFAETMTVETNFMRERLNILIAASKGLEWLSGWRGSPR